MYKNQQIQQDNHKIFALLSNYLNNAPDFIQPEEIQTIANDYVSKESAFSMILAAAFGLDIVDNEQDKQFFNRYFPEMIHQLDTAVYYTNPYYENIRFPSKRISNTELKYEAYKPYEGFVCDDITMTNEGRQIPKIGFFDKEFRFPAILENGRIWMTVTPNEVETMKEPIDKAFGNVLTYGLGLGYYAYMVSEKENVETVTIVESNENVIDLFQQHLLPQFQNQAKIHIIKDDAFLYAKKKMHKENFDFVFTDLWHDVSDGMDMYLQMKTFEKQNPGKIFSYWIEKSIKCYL